MTPISAREKSDEANREVSQRLRVYARLVVEKRMTPDKAKRQTDIMKAIAEDYRVLAEQEEQQERLL